ncbi:MAG: hypothetical protein RL757_2062 [Bacteroidota bacterium]|jgi:beta-lactamase class A/beta-lactamase class A VEB
MNKRLFALLFLLATCGLHAQSIDSLRTKIEQVLATKRALVGISIAGNQGKDTLSVNGDAHLPMQSVFKFHIALCVLSEIDKGNFSLTDEIKIDKKELLPNLYSPIREKYPEGTTLTIAEILKYTVAESDNIGCDVLLRKVGGPAVVERYFTNLHFDNISIKINEETMQSNWDSQFQNWTTPKAATEILTAFYQNKKKFLRKKSYRFLWKIMRETATGKNRLKGQLPKNTVVAHKTGWSGTNKAGITAATNDIGIVFLPDGNYFFISVFVTDSRENGDTNEKIIADIAKLAWDYFVQKKK